MEIEWLGERRIIAVAELDGGPLLGMGMLRGSRLIMDVIDGGSVSLEPLGK